VSQSAETFVSAHLHKKGTIWRQISSHYFNKVCMKTTQEIFLFMQIHSDGRLFFSDLFSFSSTSRRIQHVAAHVCGRKRNVNNAGTETPRHGYFLSMVMNESFSMMSS